MPQNLEDRGSACRKLRHDFANDIGSLKMNIEALKMTRDDHELFDQLIDLIQETIQTFDSRLTEVFSLLTGTDHGGSST